MRLTLVLYLSCLAAEAAYVHIGSEALLSQTTDQEHEWVYNRFPASNSTVRINPPVFCDFYRESVTNLVAPQVETRAFARQFSTNNFTFTNANYITSNSMFNAVATFTNSDGSPFVGTMYWRDVYYNSNMSVILFTNAVWTFTLPANAILNDRSWVTDTNYLITNRVASKILFKNQATYRSFLQTSNLASFIPGVSFGSYTGTLSIVTDPKWTADSYTLTNDPYWLSWPSSISQLGMAFNAATNEWFTNAVRCYSTTTNVMAVLGDSLCVNPAVNTNFVSLFAFPNASWGSTNLGVGGYTLWDINGDLTANYSLFANKCSGGNVALIFAGRNDIVKGSNDTQTASNLVTVTTRARTNGWRVMWLSSLNGGDIQADGTKAGYWTNYNNWMFSNWTTYAQGFVRWNTNAALDYAQTPSNWQGDNIHPALGGAQAMDAQLTNEFRLKMAPLIGDILTNWVVNARLQGYQNKESYGGGVLGEIISFPLAYAMFEDILPQICDTNCVQWMEDCASFFVYNDWLYTGTTLTNSDYSQPLAANYVSDFMRTENHKVNDGMGIAFCLGGMHKSTKLRYLFEFYLGQHFAMWDGNKGSRDGRSYFGSQYWNFGREFAPWMMANMLFDGKGLTNAYPMQYIMEMTMHRDPTGLRQRGDPWGQVGAGVLDQFIWDQSQGNYCDKFVLACLMQRGDILRWHNRNSTYNNGHTSDLPLLEVMAAYAWTPPVEADCATNVWYDPVHGWWMSSLLLPTDYGAVSNGNFITTIARPGGAGFNNGGYVDGNFEYQAQGASITIDGAGAYEQWNGFANGVFIDGLGVHNGYPPLDYRPVLARIAATTNGAWGSYVQLDLTYAIPHTNQPGTGSGDLQGATGKYYTTNSRPNLTSLKRHLIHYQKQCLIVMDEAISTNGFRLQSKFNIWNTNAVIDTNAMTATWSSTNNYTQATVPVTLQQIVGSNNIGMVVMSMTTNLTGGQNGCVAKWNPFTGEKYDGTNDWYAGLGGDPQRYWANTVWFSTKATGTNQHSMYVLMPGSDWAATRVDDYTVALTNATLSIANLVTFDTNNVSMLSAANDIVVDLATSSPPPPPPPTLIPVAKGAGKMKLSGNARIQ